MQAVAITAWHLGALLIGTFAAPAMRFLRDPARVARSGFDQILVQLYTDGGFTGMANDVPVIIGAGDICVFDLSDTISTQASAFANISVLIPRKVLHEIGDVSAIHGLVIGGGTPMGVILGDHLRSLVGNIGTLRRLETGLAAGATVALIVATPAAATRGRVRSRPVGAHVSPFRRACDYIDAHIDYPSLDVDRTALALGCSRAGLFRVFSDEGGVVRYIRRRRLAGAARDLAD